jgi:catalase-peroxidase
MDYLKLLFKYEWECKKSPAGAWQWHPIDCHENDMVPEVDGSNNKVLPMMTTADMSLKIDPDYNKICKKFLNDPKKFEDAFAKAWFKLLHRDMGPKSNYVCGDFKDVDYKWQDPIKPTSVITEEKEKEIRNRIINCGLSQIELIETAWASASTFRKSDNRGGANGSRIRLNPQINWEVNKPKQLQRVLAVFENISKEYDVSVADVIIIGGAVGIEIASGSYVKVTTGRGDATQEDTDIDSFNLLKPKTCGFRNYSEKEFSVSPEELMLDKAQLLGLSTVELTILYGGLRSIGISYTGDGIWTNGKLDNSWFKTLLSMDVKWEKTGYNSYQATNRNSLKIERKASRTDLVFGSNSELRAIVEVYATDQNKDKFINDFITVWNKIMNADRFDLI